MKQLKDIKNKLNWQKYYNPDFDWDDENFYNENILSIEFLKQFQDKINWFYMSKVGWLNELILDEFKDKIDWWHVSQIYNIFTEEFLIKFKMYLSKQILKLRCYGFEPNLFAHISKEFLSEYFKEQDN